MDSIRSISSGLSLNTIKIPIFSHVIMTISGDRSEQPSAQGVHQGVHKVPDPEVPRAADPLPHPHAPPHRRRHRAHRGRHRHRVAARAVPLRESDVAHHKRRRPRDLSLLRPRDQHQGPNSIGKFWLEFWLEKLLEFWLKDSLH